MRPLRADCLCPGGSCGTSLAWLLAWSTLGGPTLWRLSQHTWQQKEYAYLPVLTLASLWLWWRVSVRTRVVSPGPVRVSGWQRLGIGACALCGALLYGVGRTQELELLELLAFLPLATAAVAQQHGWACVRRLALPLAFPLLALPYPGWLVDAVTRPLRLALSMGAEELLHALGYPVARSGVTIALGPYRLWVADACSGLHTLIFLLALGLLYLMLTGPRARWHCRTLLLALLPLALGVNFLRIVMLLLLTHHWGDAVGQGYWHEGAGLFLFATGFGTLLLLDKGLGRLLGHGAGQPPRSDLVPPRFEVRSAPWPTAQGSTLSPERLRWSVGNSVWLLGLAALALVSGWWMPQHKLAQDRAPLLLATLVPLDLGAWQAHPDRQALTLEPRLQGAVQALYSQTLSRTYVDAQGRMVMLSVAYGARQLGNALQAHRPEYCYRAQGFELRDAADGNSATVPGLPVRRLVAWQHARIEPITYWMIVGDEPTLPGWQRKWHQLRYGLRGTVPDGWLVRVSSLDADAAAAHRQQDDFIAALLQAVPLLAGGLGSR